MIKRKKCSFYLLGLNISMHSTFKERLAL